MQRGSTWCKTGTPMRQAALFRLSLISDSAGMPSPSCDRQIILIVSQRRRVEYLMDAIAASDEGNEVTRLKSVLVHMVFDRLRRVGEVPAGVALPRLDQGHQHIEAIALRRCRASRSSRPRFALGRSGIHAASS